MSSCRTRHRGSRFTDKPPRAFGQHRPVESAVQERAVPGHWEGGLLCGSASSQIATLVEHQTRYVMLVKITSKDSERVTNTL